MFRFSPWALAAAVVLVPVAWVFADNCRTVPVTVVPYNYQYHDTTVVGIPVSPFYYSVGDTYPGERDTRIAEEVVRLLRREADREGAPAEPQPPEPTPLGPGRFRIVGVGGSGGYEDTQVLAVLNTNCVACHKPGAQKPGVQLFTEDRRLYTDPDPRNESRRRARVYDSIESGDMPKGRPPLSAGQKALIREWSNRTK